jgi:ankyrin repeat protein
MNFLLYKVILLAIIGFLWFSACTEKTVTDRLWDAVNEGDVRTVEQLIKMGANVRARKPAGETILHFAAYHGHVEIAKLLIENGVEINATTKVLLGRDTTAFDLALRKNRNDMIDLLRNYGAKRAE